jgi:hypothetical protein
MYTGFTTLLNDFERPTTPKVKADQKDWTKANPPMLNVALQLQIFHFTTDESLGVENRVGRASVERVFGRVTDTGLRIRMGCE